MSVSPRQVHLDFHTSEHMPNVGGEFDPKAFAKTVKDASISSVTVFARCHHGFLYYPSKKFPQYIHPTLQNKNLLVEQVKALHAVGVRAPVYLTVQWDYQSAIRRPEWLIRKKDGAHTGKSFMEDGFYQSLCVNTGYTDYLKELTAEVCELLGDELDGLFYDIVGTRTCWCAACRAEMEQLGYDAADDSQAEAFNKMVIDRFKLDMSSFIRQYNKDCTIFYNAGHVGPCTKKSAEAYSHFELESLPSGGWGYLHFPVTARYARLLGKDCIGMTGKFHTSWGDFHSLKNLEALEFECFRMLSFGFASSIGDQLEPCGVLNPATYDLIGKVYSQFAEREQWAMPSKAVAEIALVTPELESTEGDLPDTILGAVQMLEELAVQFDIIDADMDLKGYKLIILPDDLTVSSEFQAKVDSYVNNGGCVLACAKGGLSEDEKYSKCFGAEYDGMVEKYPSFIVAEGELAKGLEPSNQYVIYLQGASLHATEGKEILSTMEPYFHRNNKQFCSHSYTPSARTKGSAGAIQNGNSILFSHPIFTQYRNNAPKWCKQLISNAIDILMPTRLIRHNGSSTLLVSLPHQPQESRYTAHVLSYIPVRKSATIDIIEERTKVANVTLYLNLPADIKSVRLVPDNIPLEFNNGQLTIPEVNGYAIVELCY